MTHSRVPPKITKQDFALPEGLNLRQAAILGVLITCAALVAFVAQGPLPLRAFLAVLVAGTGLALAYKTIQGEPLEVWAFRTLMFNLSSRKLLVWRRGGAPRPHNLEQETPQPAPPPAPIRSARWHRPVEPEVAEDVSFIAAMANVLILAILASLSVYMATGGARQLVTYVDYLAGR